MYGGGGELLLLFLAIFCSHWDFFCFLLGLKKAGCRRAVSRRQGAEGWFQGGRVQMGALEPVCLFIY